MSEKILCNCLYFTSARLSRILTNIAEEEFKTTGLFPSQALALMIINKNPGISQNYLSKELEIKQSTISRFIDKLEHKQLVKRKASGKKSYLYPTEKGISLQKEIDKSWNNLHHRYSKILGYAESTELNQMIHNAGEKLNKES